MITIKYADGSTVEINPRKNGWEDKYRREMLKILKARKCLSCKRYDKDYKTCKKHLEDECLRFYIKTHMKITIV